MSMGTSTVGQNSIVQAPQLLGSLGWFDRNTKILLLLFFLSLPLVNPWVRGDGVGYYAYVRSMLVEHKLDFQNDWRHANLGFTLGKVHENGTVDAALFTPTGHLENHFAVGPSIL